MPAGAAMTAACGTAGRSWASGAGADADSDADEADDDATAPLASVGAVDAAGVGAVCDCVAHASGNTSIGNSLYTVFEPNRGGVVDWVGDVTKDTSIVSSSNAARRCCGWTLLGTKGNVSSVPETVTAMSHNDRCAISVVICFTRLARRYRVIAPGDASLARSLQ
ncbi:MAG: hypothetical protein Tsb0020_36460 [Haliangiales bacterium]